MITVNEEILVPNFLATCPLTEEDLARRLAVMDEMNRRCIADLVYEIFSEEEKIIRNISCD